MFNLPINDIIFMDVEVEGTGPTVGSSSGIGSELSLGAAIVGRKC